MAQSIEAALALKTRSVYSLEFGVELSNQPIEEVNAIAAGCLEHGYCNPSRIVRSCQPTCDGCAISAVGAPPPRKRVLSRSIFTAALLSFTLFLVLGRLLFVAWF